MIKYHCPKCRTEFFQEGININQKHHCGEFADLEWGTEYQGAAEGDIVHEEK
jgi:hypothetical protein